MITVRRAEDLQYERRYKVDFVALALRRGTGSDPCGRPSLHLQPSDFGECSHREGGAHHGGPERPEDARDHRRGDSPGVAERQTANATRKGARRPARPSPWRGWSCWRPEVWPLSWRQPACPQAGPAVNAWQVEE